MFEPHMFSSNTPVQTRRKLFRAFTNQLVNRNNTHNQQHQQDRQPPSEESINTNGQQPQATVNKNGIGGQPEDQQLPLASLILGHPSRINLRLPRPSNLPTVPLSYAYSSTTTHQTTNKQQQQQQQLINILNINQQQHPLTLSHQQRIIVGSSMGGMQSIVTAWLKPQRAQRMVSISGCGRTGPSSIALQYAQRKSLSTPSFSNLQHSQKRLSSLLSHSPEHQSSLSVQLANHSSAVMDSRTSLKPINDSNNAQNQSLRVNARGPLKDNRRSGELLMEETLEERLAQGLSTGGTSEDPGQTVGLDNGCKQSPATDQYGCNSIQQTLLSQEDQKGEDPVK
ncbi:hypothetical protein PPACK8108_LOCUS3008 [Phakopsora pachyrhizi]|uniref:Uncharacterized protein n=1 Tax=Phakopsora pachyrhizi TaxID=170000 RepID=A0AAV0AJL8_PHAPC|nr:hypothetical protein PPACK8108_LOCUS3008 [Phakopsora pachyrhizi]